MELFIPFFIPLWRIVLAKRFNITSVSVFVTNGTPSSFSSSLKISMSNLGKYIDFLIPAYDHRVFKPDIGIFKIALESVECYPDETVMIGDNWNADIKGAINAGIVPIWVNFRNEPPPEPDFPNIIRTFYPPSETIGKIEEFFTNGLSNIPIPDPLL